MKCKEGKSYYLSGPDGQQKTNNRCCTACRRSFAHEANNPVNLQSLRRRVSGLPKILERSCRDVETKNLQPGCLKPPWRQRAGCGRQTTTTTTKRTPPCRGPISTAQYSQSISLNIIGFLSLTVKKYRCICIQI